VPRGRAAGTKCVFVERPTRVLFTRTTMSRTGSPPNINDRDRFCTGSIIPEKRSAHLSIAIVRESPRIVVVRNAGQGTPNAPY
jgi:hypothetical protein